MADLSTPLEELYSTARNFNKLKFSNNAYMEATREEGKKKQEEIDELKDTYKQLKEEVQHLKQQYIYKQNRVKSASGNQYTYYRLQLDLAKNQKLKSKEEWKKNTEKYNDLKNEAKIINDDNNPYVRRIKLLENKLDKAMIKYNEALTVRRTYEEILSRLKKERSGYDGQIKKIQDSLKSKYHDLNEFKLLLQDSAQAKAASDNLVKGTQESQLQFKKHFDELIANQKKEALKQEKMEKAETKVKRKNSFGEQLPKVEEQSDRFEKNEKIKDWVTILDFRDAQIQTATGVDDINEICQKYSNLKETTENLENEKKDLEKMLENLRVRRQTLSIELNKLKFSSQDEITRKEIEDHEKNVQKNINNCENSRQKLKKEEKLMVDIHSGVETLVTILKDKLFEECFNVEDINSANDLTLKQEYLDVINSFKDDRDLKTILNKINELFKYLDLKVADITKKCNLAEEEEKLENKENQELENIYIGQEIDSNENSEYGPEDDLDADMQAKDQGKKDMPDRPFTTNPAKMRTYIKARDKLGK